VALVPNNTAVSMEVDTENGIEETQDTSNKHLMSADDAIAMLISCSLIDSPAPLSSIVGNIVARIKRVSSTVGSDVAALSRYEDPIVLGEHIKGMGSRKSFGNRPTHTHNVWEDVSEMAIWRWECARVPSASFAVVESYESSMSDVEKRVLGDIKTEAVMRENKQSFGRVGTAIKSLQKVIDEVKKLPLIPAGETANHEMKISLLEEKASKAIIEMEKAKERQLLQEKKKMEQLAEAARKLREKELKEAERVERELAKQKMKEEALNEKKSRMSAAAESKEGKDNQKKLSEKELKNKLQLEKQQKAFHSFLKREVSLSKTTINDSNADSALKSGEDVVFITPSSSQNQLPGSVCEKSNTAVRRDYCSFHEDINSGVSLVDIMSEYREK
jgi:hypothetical protein